jgi:hypothetical protein
MANEPWLIRDYSGWWRLPEPLPLRTPWTLLALVVAELVVAAVLIVAP